MAITVSDVTIISITSVVTSLLTKSIPSETRGNIRIMEIVGGLLTAQLARRANTKATGAGVMVGALTGFVDDFFRFGTSTKIKNLNPTILKLESYSVNPQHNQYINQIAELHVRWYNAKNFT